MCGIAGLFGAPGGVDLDAAVRRMAAELVHRGPDDEGVWLDPTHRLALAHRRLSIIDLSPQGHQPMHSVSGRYVMAYNGEIYNFEQIRAELAAQGRAPAWRGHSDTEVLLAAVEAWGFEDTLTRTVGMFAIALWDRETATLSLARDRIGEKPLYYGPTEQGFAFASELKAIRALCGGTLALDRQALSEFMQFGYVPGRRCIFRGLAKLPPGHFVHIGAGGTAGEPQPYWRLDSPAGSNLAEQLAGADDSQLIELLHDRLKASVEFQMVSDVPLGAFLSGGVDSSTVVALMQAQSARRVKTYTIGFHEKAFDEAPYAKAVAQHLGTDHTELYVSADDAAAIIPDLPRIYDEPFADSSQIPTTLVSRLTRRHVTVSLSGDGGDELFAGYPRYAITAALWQRINSLPMGLRRGAARALRSASPQGWDRVLGLLPVARRQSINGRRVHRLAQLLASNSLAEMYVRLMSQWQPEEGLVLGVRGSVIDPLRWTAQGTPIQQMRRWDMGQYLPDDLLVKVDRAAMSASLESRAPLLDHRVVELAFALPERMLVRDGQGKWILRRVLDRYVPRELIERPKAGFSVPLAKWLRGPLEPWASDLLDPARMRRDGLLDAENVAAMWQEHRCGSFDRSAYLWNVLMFQAWHAEVARQIVPSRPAF
ncbi:MAG: asparagine synthase (glutamine-hydrolyzing) [Burkholderiales bacterium]|nr:asparagine synthase (glutamine-hydrolyzing) [Burkholderiales bacterium]